MALTNCPECNREISSNAQLCPGCGAPGPALFAQELHRLVELEAEAQKVSVPRTRGANKAVAARTIVEGSEAGTNPTVAGSADKRLEANIARLESEIENIIGDVSEIKSNIRVIQKDSRIYFRIVWGGIIFFGVGLAGLMAKGFQWI